ncbi:class I lanthipeptide [Chitinophaga solisilvae]|uniref:Class I lanthipeptide n=1 Tax=Chitinophaga solisilvae TaxID=1233460 RepID=A0A9Q5DCN9_9BACT|nr:class I lanthipeptide [Chitinophaga solisilvae]NSL88335.1 hypothetical protein [Chitinophaga solisilvae]
MKKKLSLKKKLVMHKFIVADLNKLEQSQVIGGIATTTRFETCETYVAPTRCLKCPD